MTSPIPLHEVIAMQNGIAGRWRSTTDTPCSQRYPRELEFDPRGIYTSRSDGAFTLWDSGGWTMLGADQIRISTANDAEISYPFRVSGDRLAFRDPQGCEFEYQRIG